MDDAVRAALARWPDVPHAYDWLRLDRRGRWRVPDGPIAHPGLIAFIQRNYEQDPRGCWFFQNGPQRVYVTLDYTPWILQLRDGAVLRHDGQAFAQPESALIDREGSVLLAGETSVGLVDDRDLPGLVDGLRGPDGRALGAALLERLIAGEPCGARLEVVGHDLPVTPVRREEVAPRFGFDPRPQAAD